MKENSTGCILDLFSGYPKRCTLEDPPLPNKALFGWLNNITVLLTNSLGNVLRVTDPIFHLNLKQDTNLRIKQDNIQTDML